MDHALNETFSQLEQNGSGVEVDDVVRAPARERRGQSRTPARQERQERDDQPTRRSSRRASPDQDVDSYEVLADDPDDETQESPDIDEDDEDDEDDLEDDDDDEGDDDPDVEDISDEVEEDDDDLGPETDDEDDEDDRATADSRKRSSKSKQQQGSRRAAFPKKIQREIDRQVKAQVQRALAENDTLRQRETERKNLDSENAKFLTQVLGTKDELDRLESIALDARQPQAKRDEAARWLQGYRNNRNYFERYKSGAWAVIRHQQAQEDLQVIQKVGQLRALDPKIVGEGNRAKTLLHAYVTGMEAAKAIADKENAKLRRQVANKRGTRAESSARNGLSRRRPASMASSNARRGNGRVAQPDRTRGVLANERGIGAGSQIPFPTDDILARIRNDELSLADIGLAPARSRRR